MLHCNNKKTWPAFTLALKKQLFALLHCYSVHYSIQLIPVLRIRSDPVVSGLLRPPGSGSHKKTLVNWICSLYNILWKTVIFYPQFWVSLIEVRNWHSNFIFVESESDFSRPDPQIRLCSGKYVTGSATQLCIYSRCYINGTQFIWTKGYLD